MRGTDRAKALNRNCLVRVHAADITRAPRAYERGGELRVPRRIAAGLVARARSIRVLPPLDERSQMGALISAAHVRKVAGHVDEVLDAVKGLKKEAA